MVFVASEYSIVASNVSLVCVGSDKIPFLDDVDSENFDTDNFKVSRKTFFEQMMIALH